MTNINVAKTASTRQKLIVAAVAASCAGSALALDFKTDSGWSGSINTTLTYSSSWRAQDQDKSLVTPMNAVGLGWQPNYVGTKGSGSNPFPVTALGRPAGLPWLDGPPPGFNALPGVLATFYQSGLAGYTGASNGATGNLNYDKGDRYSEMFKVISDLSISKDGMGGLLRVKGWYDNALNNNNVPWGNQPNRFTHNQPLSDDSAPPFNRFDGIELLDAYVYTGFDLGDNPGQVRVGRHALNWGESLFFQGVNQISPLDVTSLRRAGTEIKEALLPIWAVSGSVGLAGGTSLEAFYQMKWEPSAIDGAGTYWAGDINISTNAGATPMLAGFGANMNNAQQFNFAGYPAPYHSYASFVDGKKGSNGGQYGVAFRFPVEAIDTEFGLYAMRINARLPILSFYNSTARGTTGLNPPDFVTGLVGANGVKGFLEYPDDIKIYGLSAATTLGGISWGAELSYQQDVPVQINTGDLLIAVGGAAIWGGAKPGLQPGGLTLITGQGFGPMGPTVMNTQRGGYVSGYELHDKWQFQLNGIAMLPAMLGATNGTMLGEVAFQLNDLPDYKVAGNKRFGRAAEFGISPVSYGDQFGIYGALSGAKASGFQCAESPFGPQLNQAGCKNDGYMTKFAWAYKLRAQLDYPDFMESGITVSPIVFFAHDVDGHSMDYAMIEGRKTLSLGLRLNRNKTHNLDLNYTTYSDKATYDPLRDRDNYSIAYSYTF